jgi:hypothetical protein
MEYTKGLVLGFIIFTIGIPSLFLVTLDIYCFVKLMQRKKVKNAKFNYRR